MSQRLRWRWGVVCLAALTGGLQAQEFRLSPPPRDDLSAAIRNEKAPWLVRVAVDRPDRAYEVGEFVNVRVISEEDGFLYLANKDTSGAYTLLVPNRHMDDNRIAAKVPVDVPGKAGFRLRVGSRGLGKETLMAVVTKRPYPELHPKELSRDGPTPMTEEQTRRLLSAITLGSPIAQGDLLAARSRSRSLEPEEYDRQSRQYAEHNVEFLTVPARPAPTSGKRWALSMGVGHYKSPDFNVLNFAANDAKRIAVAARQACGFGGVLLLVEEQVTLENMRRAFRALAETSKVGDTVLVFFGGHGSRMETGDPSRPYRYMLNPYDATDKLDDSFTEDEFGRCIQALDGRRVMIILDACHTGGHIDGARDGLTRRFEALNGNSRRPPEPAHLLEAFLDRSRSIGQRDAAILTACRLDQSSWEIGSLRGGLLTHAVLRVIAETRGPLTLQKTYQGVRPIVEAELRSHHYEGTQDPVFSDQTPPPPALLRP